MGSLFDEMNQAKEENKSFKNLADGKYPVVLENLKLDLVNKYGPRLNLEFELNTGKKLWVDLRGHRDGSRKGIYITLSNLNAEAEIEKHLIDTDDESKKTEALLEACLKYFEGKVGHYFLVKVQTDGDKNYKNLIGTSTKDQFDNFVMDDSGDDDTNAPSSVDPDDEIPF